jgi:hypothetical protein
MQWTGSDKAATGADSTVTTIVLNDGRRVVLLGCTSPISNETIQTVLGCSFGNETLRTTAAMILQEIDKQEEEYFEPIVPTSIKFEQRKFDRQQAKVEHMRSDRLANNHFARRTKFRKLGRKKIRRS